MNSIGKNSGILWLKESLFGVLFVAFACFPFATAADVIIMKNGDRMSGDVVTQTQSNITIRTTYAGNVSVSLDEVRELQLDKPEAVLLKDESLIQIERAEFAEDGIRVRQAGVGNEITLTEDQVAQFAPEPWRLGRGGEFSGMFNLTMEFEKGNSVSEELDLDYNLTYRRLNDRFRSIGDLEMDSNDKVQTKQDWSVLGKYDRFVSDSFYTTYIASFSQEKYSDLYLRSTVGPAIGYQFLESNESNLLLEFGAFWTDERLISTPNQSYWGPGWRLEYDRLLFKDRIEFYHRQIGLQTVTDEGGLLWQAWTGLTFPLWGGIALTAEHEIDYDGDPRPGVDELDNTLNLKVGYKW